MNKEYFDTKKIKGRYEQAIATETAKALMYFCKREPEFKQAIEQSGKTFQECLSSICKGAGASMSDLETYNRAAKFYFPIATVHFDMRINLSGDNGHEDPPITMTENNSTPAPEKPKTSGLTISLDDLLDF